MAANAIKKQSILFPNSNEAVAVSPSATNKAEDIVAALDIKPHKAMILVLGGAASIDKKLIPRLAQLFGRGIARAAAEANAIIIDGGTQAGVMAMMGEGVAGRGYKSMLVGVAPASLGELRQNYHAVLFTCGAETDRRLGVPGEDLRGSHTATEFVGWYNGHPDYRDRVFDLSHEVAVIIGQGNVAADVCRILAKTADELKHTDISEHALGTLAESKVREIHAVGRRGPAQAKFTSRELREFGELGDCYPRVDALELALNPESEAELADKSKGKPREKFTRLHEMLALVE